MWSECTKFVLLIVIKEMMMMIDPNWKTLWRGALIHLARQLMYGACLIFLGLYALLARAPYSSALDSPALYSKGEVLEQELLEEGNLVKIAVTKSGVYRISYDELRKLGFQKPEEVGVFGYGGAALSERLSQAPQKILPAVPVLHEGESVYFFAYGATSVYFDRSLQRLRHHLNPYSTEGFYFLADGLQKKAIKPATPPSEPNPIQTDTYSGYYIHERELYSLKQSGRLLVGELLSNGASLPLELETSKNVLEGKEIKLQVGYVSLPSVQGKLSLLSGSSVLLEDEIFRHEEETPVNYLRGIYHLCNSSFQGGATGHFSAKAQFTPAYEKAYIDFISVETENKLSYNEGKQFIFRKPTKTTAEAMQFVFSDLPSDVKVWAAFSPNDIRELSLSDDKSFVYATTKKDGNPIEFVAFRPGDAFTPRIVGKTIFRRIREHKGIPDLIIISTNGFIDEAKRLGRFHQETEGKNVLVVTAEEVYNEFSSGTPDATAYRLLVKYFYDRWRRETASTTSDLCPIHLLLFGDGAADNRMLSSEWLPLKNRGVEFLLTYESENSLNVNSYVADDYFGMVTEGEDALHDGGKTVSVGIGRFTVRTPFEARQAVDKCIAYGENKQLGDWKLNSVIVADNGDNYGHLRRGELLSQVINAKMPEMLLTKVYFDAFPKETKNGLTTFPGAKRKLMNALDKGMLIFNYTGHGNPYALSDEQIVKLSDIQQFDYKHLPLWITATCDFANFDHPITSAGESAFLNANSGAIALVTTARVVYDIYNQQLNEAFLEEILKRNKEGKSATFGEAIKRSKNRLRVSSDEGALVNKLHFFLIGDPLLSLNIPSHRAVVERINGNEVGGKAIELHALDKVTIEGSIRTPSNEIEGNFTGHLFVTIFDSETEVSTLEANRPNHADNDAVYKDYTGLIYAGQVPIKDGFFSFDFIVPKDVTYEKGATRINLYAYAQERKLEAMGVDFSSRIVTGGKNSEIDTTPPEIRLCYLSDSTKRDHFLTGPTPIFYAEIFDNSGINLSSGGLGHQITLAIDNRSDYTFALNEYYQASSLEQGLGKVVYTLPPLEEGDHTALFTVWDVHNNCSQKSFSFRVHKDLSPQLQLSKLYPNPVGRGAPLTIEIVTNAPGELFKGYVELIDFTGRVVSRSNHFTFKSTLDTPASYTFTPSTSYGSFPVEGLYLLRLVATSHNGQQVFTTHKLVIKNNNSVPAAVE